MIAEQFRRRGVQTAVPVPVPTPSSTERGAQTFFGPRCLCLWRRRGVGGLLCLLGVATLGFLLGTLLLVGSQERDGAWFVDRETHAQQQRQALEDARRPSRCPPLSEALVVPAERAAAAELRAAAHTSAVSSTRAEGLPPYAFTPAPFPHRDAVERDAPGGVAALSAYCAARIGEDAVWRHASWQVGGAANASALRVLVSPRHAATASYVATGGPVCLRAGRVYLTDAALRAGAADFDRTELPVSPLSDSLFAASSLPQATATVVPAVAVLLHGVWIANHFVHLVTDALEALHSTYHTWQDGVLRRIPTQTVLLHQPESNWVDRHGDSRRKMEMSAVLANAFSSPEMGRGSPFNTSFLFETESRQCAAATATAAAADTDTPAPPIVCFCDGLLVTTQRLPLLERVNLYGIQDWAARQFRTSPYGTNRSVREMERQRLRHSLPSSWVTSVWRVGSSNASSSPSSVYAPRVLFVHRTTRLIANASRYAAWMREIGFRVEEVYLETLSAAQQHYLGRYADVVVGMHGLGLGHAMWMERSPPGCRTVVEFRPWVHPLMPTQPVLILGTAMQFNFVHIAPIDVQFGPSIANPAEERELLLSSERMINAFRYPSFTDQTAVYDSAKVWRVFADVRQHLANCLPT
ncbi:hypothetical protein NESM_000325200 [Novymonas esmeraldas]|uniref:Glycosyltransferase 61 catalytic domain-containing protein n=1 Tax=Novymonas esmeraldas TaxID=1808958 RepID=A0AAW0EMI5_9TRYP